MRRPAAGGGFATTLALGLTLLATIPCVAARADVGGRRTVDLPLLLDLPGDLASVRYTPGTLDRAASVQARFELLADEFTRTRYLAAAVVFYVLSPEDWEAAGLVNEYGEPQALGTDALVVPAWADAEMVARVGRWLGGEAPKSAGLPLLATREEAGALGVSDLLAQVAVARLLATRANLRGDAVWIAPVMAHVVARLAWDKFEPGRMPEIARLFDAMAAQDKTAGGHPQSGWDEALPLPERAWFEARFLRAADLIVLKKGPRGARKLLNQAVTGTQPLSQAVLFKEVPALADWLATNFPAESAPSPVVPPAPAPPAH
jgi:hypothetical protein